MSLCVWKYEVPGTPEFQLALPNGAQLLTVAVQPSASGIMLWALVDPEEPMGMRSFRLAGTGHPIDAEMHDLRFIGSVQLEQGALVFHLFEVLTGPF